MASKNSLVLENLKLSKLGNMELTKVDLSMNVDASADYATNANEYYRKAMIGENSARSRFRQVLGIKDRVKLGNATFSSLIKPGGCDFDPSGSTIKQLTFEVCPLMIGTAVCVEDLETSFVSDQIARGSADFNDKFAFMSYFYETLSMEAAEQMDILTFQGDSTLTGLPADEAYLASCDGLEKKLEDDVTVLKPNTPSEITSTNIIDKLKEARNALPKAVKNRGDFVYMLSTDAYEAYADAISDNKASGQYFVEGVPLTFQGKEVFHAEGASDNTIIAGNWVNFLNIQDMVSDEDGFTVVDFYKTSLTRKIGVRTDFKFNPSFVKGNEVFFHGFVGS